MIRLVFSLIFLPIRLPIYLFRKILGLKKNSWLHVSLTGEYPESPPSLGWLQMLKPEKTRFYELALSLDSILRTLEESPKKLKELKEVVITINQPKIGWARAWEIRSLLARFSKFEINTSAYLLSMEKISLYIATGCKNIYAPPAASFDISGATSESLFFSGALAKLGIKPQFISIGKYKSAAEMFTRKKHSKPSKNQLQDILEKIDSELTGALTERGLKFSKNDLFLLSAQEAHQKGLLTDVLYPEQFDKLISEIKLKKGSRERSIQETLKTLRHRRYRLFPIRKTMRIAVLAANGAILDSSQSMPGTINLFDFEKPLEKIAGENFDALVIRINSPGGSALASDILWQKIMSLQSDDKFYDADDRFSNQLDVSQTKKTKHKKNKNTKRLPIIVSQGDVAASGGYYLSALNKNIVSTPLSITGSIGVIAGKFDISGFVKKLGVSIDKIEVGKEGGWLSPFSSFNKKTKTQLEGSLKNTYALFRNRVSLGRKMSDDKIKNLAQGRVYSGADAYKVGLVDHLGGLNDAIKLALKKAGRKSGQNIEIEFLPRIKTPMIQSSLSRIPFLKTVYSFIAMNRSNFHAIDPKLVSIFQEDETL